MMWESPSVGLKSTYMEGILNHYVYGFKNYYMNI